MKYIQRTLEKHLGRAVRHFPAVVLTGPRRAGKTMLLRRLFPKASYFLLEDPDVVARLRADPQGFLDGVKTHSRNMFLVHQEPKAGTATAAVSPGVRALPWRSFLDEL